MKDLELHSIYNNVCDAPKGASLNIEHIPHFLDVDTEDNFAPHVHTFYEIIWFQEGGGSHCVDFQSHPIEPNTLFFLAPGQIHHFEGSARNKGVLVQFCTDFMKDESADEDIFLKYGIFNVFDADPYYILHDETATRRIAEIIGQMEEEIRHKGEFGHIDLLRSLVRQFIIFIHRYGERKDAFHLDTMKSSHRLFMRFRQLVEQEYTRLHQVKEFADRLNVSVKTLSNAVSECANKSPLTFINERVLLEARRLLRHSDLMVKEIADRLGFEDTSYFVKFFKRGVGVLPKEYREG